MARQPQAASSDGVTWKALTRYAVLTAFFLAVIAFFVVRDLDSLRKGIDDNTSVLKSLEIETVKALGAVREQLVETNTNLKNLINETRQNRPKQ